MANSEQVLQIIYICLTIISSILLFLIFIVFSLNKSLRHYSNWQIIFLSFSTFVSGISYLINYIGLKSIIDSKGFLCIFQGFIMIWSDMSLYSWSTLINYSIYYYTIHFDKIKSDTIPLAWWVGDALIGYVIPFSYALIMFSSNSLGKNGDYCWIKEGTKEDRLNVPVMITYSFAWLFMIINIILSGKVILFICRLNKEAQEYAKNFVEKLLLFPIIQVIASLPLTIYRLLFFFVDNPSVIMNYLGLYGFACMGIFIAFVFGKNMKLFEIIFKFCSKKEEESNSLNDDSIDNISALKLRSSILEEEGFFR